MDDLIRDYIGYLEHIIIMNSDYSNNTELLKEFVSEYINNI